jgi:hypothetical protein
MKPGLADFLIGPSRTEWRSVGAFVAAAVTMGSRRDQIVTAAAHWVREGVTRLVVAEEAG